MIEYLLSPSTINLCGLVLHVPLIAHYTWHGFLICFGAAGLSMCRADNILK